MNVIIVVESDDWEGLYVNDILVSEGHTLNEGARRELYFHYEICKEYDVNIEDIIYCKLNDFGEDWLSQHGRLPKNWSEIKNFTFYV